MFQEREIETHQIFPQRKSVTRERGDRNAPKTTECKSKLNLKDINGYIEMLTKIRNKKNFTESTLRVKRKEKRKKCGESEADFESGKPLAAKEPKERKEEKMDRLPTVSFRKKRMATANG